MNVEGKHILVVGLARSGLAAAQILARRGAVVTVTDRKPPGEFGDVLAGLLKDKVGLELGAQREETFLRHEAIVISPGVPWDLPELEAARQRNIPIYPEVEVATWFLEGTMVGVTGSNGKTTTTTLLGNMLSASGFPTFVGGNIGNALSSAVGHAQPGTKFVTELSSFQLEAIHDLHPQVAVMLNLSPNHLDRHPSLEAYAQAKRQIFRNQSDKDFAVLNADDPWVAGLGAEVRSRPVLFSRRRELSNGVFASAGKVFYRVRHLERLLFETRDVPVRGDFNLEDVLAATTAACVLGADFTAIRKAVREFKAVEHRLEFVREIQGVQFYNNSKATSVDATLKSLGAFERGVHLIMGGKDKGAPYTPLLPLIKNRVREILLIGAAAPMIAAQLSGSTDLVQAGDLAAAVNEAFAHSQPGDTVLLAPACSSFDQFKDYEQRGHVFKELVNRLDREVWEGKVKRKPAPAVEKKSPAPNVDASETVTSGARPEAANNEPGIVFEESKQDSHMELPGPPGISHSVDADAKLESPRAPAVVPASDVCQPSEPAAVHGHIEAVAEQSEPPASAESAESSPAEPVPGIVAANDVVIVSESMSEAVVEPPVSTPPGTEPADEGEAAGASAAEPRDKGSARPLELTYIFEVDAVEMPGGESQLVPEDEPTISVSESTAEELEEEALPYETRPTGRVSKKSSGKQGKISEGTPSPKQQRLPGVE